MDKTIEHMRVDLVKVEELRELLTARGKVLVTTMEGKRVQALPDCLKGKLKDRMGKGKNWRRQLSRSSPRNLPVQCTVSLPANSFSFTS
jgi:hypothetical protein